MPARKYTRQDLRDAADKYKNWGKWGPDDEIGTLNYTSPEDIIAAARLVPAEQQAAPDGGSERAHATAHCRCGFWTKRSEAAAGPASRRRRAAVVPH